MSDLISRQDAIDAMAELQGKASSKRELTGISKAWKKIKKLPSAEPTYTDSVYRLWKRAYAAGQRNAQRNAQPERKPEHWIIHKGWLDEGLCGYECPKCSRCYDYPMNFCGFCGSPMEVEHETD